MKKIIFLILMIIAACLGGAKAYIDHRLGIELNASISEVADSVAIEYSEVSTSLLGSAYIRDMRLTVPNYAPVLVDTIMLHEAYKFYNPNTLPQHIAISIQGMQIPIKNTAAPAPVLISALGYAPYYLTPKELRGLGYARINADIDIEVKQLGDNKMFLAGRIDAHAWGELTVSVDLSHVPTALASLPKVAFEIQLVAGSLTYTNKGFFEKLFTRLAQRNYLTVNHLKKGLISKLKSDISQAGIILDSSVLTSLQQFIQSPDKLIIRLQPNPAIRIHTLFLRSPKRLGLKMSVTNPK
jgi:hypothetical protein